ncbi:hypothetical protein [Hyphomicrobium sp.]|uniref:hypothetical protein n=1 Tax=Hyphomicrobium sp. TaxID=82 RepID=UPI002FDC99F3
MYEKISDRLIPTERFLWRLLKHALYVFCLLAVSLTVGAVGFMLLEGSSLEAAAFQSAHILSGFGLAQVPSSLPGRMFAAAFGLYASLFFLAAFSVIFAPVVHRILHKLHLDEDQQKNN